MDHTDTHPLVAADPAPDLFEAAARLRNAIERIDVQRPGITHVQAAVPDLRAVLQAPLQAATTDTAVRRAINAYNSHRGTGYRAAPPLSTELTKHRAAMAAAIAAALHLPTDSTEQQ